MRHRTVVWSLIGIGCVSFVLLGLWLLLGPYSMMIAQLHPGMSYEEVRAKFGEDGFGAFGGPIYRMEGADTMLLVVFDGNQNQVIGWSILEVPKDIFEVGGVAEFKIKKFQRYPGPVVEGSDLGSIKTRIAMVGETGAPIRRVFNH